MKKEGEWVLERMRALCSRREYCSSSIRRKVLKATEGDAAKTEQIVESLKKDGYIDDRRYASAYAREKASIAGWGAVKIRHMLLAQGVASEAVSEAMEAVDGNSAGQRLEKLLKNKYRSLKDDTQCRLKMLRFALGRGYSYEEVSSQIDSLIRSEAD